MSTLDPAAYLLTLGTHARQAAQTMSTATTSVKNQALTVIGEVIHRNRHLILKANEQDLANGENNDLAPALLDRLALTPERIDQMIEGLQQVAALPDPIGTITDLTYRPSGIQVGKMRSPLGVIGIIYESRPNVTVEAASLTIKSGNSTILRGGSEALHSNQALGIAIAEGLTSAQLPSGAVQIVNTTDRAMVSQMITHPEWIDVIVPRGGKGLISRINAEARVPVIKHLDGICHIYIDSEADISKAVDVTINAKTHRYGTCNTLETLLIDNTIAPTILPLIADPLSAKQVELRGCQHTQALLPGCKPATEEDWATEYLAPILSIKLVGNIEEAITHINQYGSHHTDAILTNNYTKAQRFLAAVDSSSVMVNASTRFADGFEYGLGAEIGISTDKIHARGPVGLEGLTCQKFIVLGDGHIRQ